MSETKILKRSEVPVEFTWNAPSIFASPQAWEEAMQSLKTDLPRIDEFRGRMADGADTLFQALELRNSLIRQAMKIYVYAELSHETDTGDANAARMLGQVMGLFGQFNAALAFIDPEIIALGREKVNAFMLADDRLKIYAQEMDDHFRQQAHVRSAEVESVLGMLAAPFGGVMRTASLMTDADFKFKSARSSEGKDLPVAQGTYEELLASPDRESRRSAFESYTDTYLSFKNTLANNLTTYIQQNIFNARVRGYSSTLEAALFRNNVPVEVFHNLVDTFKQHLPSWHRYWAVRRKALGVGALQPYDIWAPLTAKRQPVPYQQAVEWICAGLEPMGAEYVSAMRKGILEDRWIDVYPNEGKSSAQFSSGSYDTHPFIFTNYDNTIFSLSTLAHELGHSMHSYLSRKHQPFIYGDYSIFAAEVASNFHQAMVRAYLLDHNSDPDFQISVIEEAMSNFHRYFFIMPTLARFEYETYTRAEKGQGMAADDMNALCADLFAEGYGSEMEYERDRIGITWATFGHLYMNYYVFQYTTGISGANALSRRILAGQSGAVEKYLGFLGAGSSLYPLDALKRAGVDLSTPAPIEEAFEVFEGLVDRLEKLVEQRQS